MTKDRHGVNWMDGADQSNRNNTPSTLEKGPTMPNLVRRHLLAAAALLAAPTIARAQSPIATIPDRDIGAGPFGFPNAQMATTGPFRIGMTRVEVERVLETQYQVARFNSQPQHVQVMMNGVWLRSQPFTQAAEVIGVWREQQSQERVSFGFSSPITGNRVVRISRTQGFAPGAMPNLDASLAIISGRYGAPTQVRHNRLERTQEIIGISYAMVRTTEGAMDAARFQRDPNLQRAMGDLHRNMFQSVPPQIGVPNRQPFLPGLVGFVGAEIGSTMAQPGTSAVTVVIADIAFMRRDREALEAVVAETAAQTRPAPGRLVP
jgi:hypothetical protein